MTDAKPSESEIADDKKETVEISLFDLKMLCLHVDYQIKYECLDIAESISSPTGQEIRF